MITNDKVKSIQKKIELAILEIEAQENVQIEFGTISYSAQKYSTTMSVKTLEKSELLERTLELTCQKLGFTQNVIGMEFEWKNLKYEIVDIKTTNRKYPIICQQVFSGAQYKFGITTVKKLLGGDKQINRNKNLDKLVH
jgi:hypothetical protein